MIVDVISCKDCKYWHDAEEGYVESAICERRTAKWSKLIDDGTFHEANPNDYCSWAVRKENE